MGQAASDWKQKRSVNTLLQLAPERNPGHDGSTSTFRRETLLAALSNVAAAINKKKGHVTIIAVGGAVNTIYLRSRETTHDVDFFNNNLTAEDFERLKAGVRAASKIDKTLTRDWLNNRTAFFIPKDKQHSLTAQALNQREVIFEEPGLTVLAAPWEYAFCGKVDRLSVGGLHSAQDYDLSDALEYLRRYLTKSELEHIPKSTVQA
ncbi:uncharacterized protein FIESC28_10037 [Fusarium coffeatum]|uniref:DUF7582 domain-containing protein n=1 Tax=Fusarium coffeatum TaxID=231269 RepID=A0A366QVW3_9HYPO|nr:uncharacterized protein FIESC28_10037 [Fusarium coffeatum]RBR09029.1 hypothetical protein FIESC28_10037 [Fusarium coffeatum]